MGSYYACDSVSCVSRAFLCQVTVLRVCKHSHPTRNVWCVFQHPHEHWKWSILTNLLIQRWKMRPHFVFICIFSSLLAILLSFYTGTGMHASSSVHYLYMFLTIFHWVVCWFLRNLQKVFYITDVNPLSAKCDTINYPSSFFVQKNTTLFLYSKEYNCSFDIAYDILWLSKVVNIHLVKNSYLLFYVFLDFLVYFKSFPHSKVIKCFLKFPVLFCLGFCSMFKYLVHLKFISFSQDFILKNFKHTEHLIEFHRAQPYTRHVYSRIKILLCLLVI